MKQKKKTKERKGKNKQTYKRKTNIQKLKQWQEKA